MTTLLLGYCIIHDFLITQAILNSEDHIFVHVCAWTYEVNTDREEEPVTVGRTTVYC